MHSTASFQVLPLLAMLLTPALVSAEPTLPATGAQPAAAVPTRSPIEDAFREGDYLRAIELGEQLLQTPDQATNRDLTYLGMAYLGMGRCQTALETWERIIALGPEVPAQHVAYFDALQRAGFAEQALPALAKAVSLAPLDADIRGRYANALARAKRVDEAIEELFAILQQNIPAEDRASVVKMLADLGSQHERRDEITAWFRQRAHDHAGDVTAQEDLLRSLTWPEAQGEAIAVAESVSGMQPQNSKHVATLLRLYEISGRLADAELLLQEAVTESDEARLEFGVPLVDLLNRLGKRDERDQWLQQLQADFSQDSAVIKATAKVLAGDGKWDELAALLASLGESRLDVGEAIRVMVVQLVAQGVDSAEGRAFVRHMVLDPADSIPNREHRFGPEIFVAHPEGEQEYTEGPSPYEELPRVVVNASHYTALKWLKESAADTMEFSSLVDELRLVAEPFVIAPTDSRGVAGSVRVYLVALVMSERDEEALALLQRLWNLGARDQDLLNVELMILEKLKNHERLRERYTVLKDVEKYAFPARAGLMHLDLASSRFDEVEQTAIEMLSLQRFPNIMDTIVKQLHQANEHERAVRIVQALAAQAPKTPDSMQRLTHLYSFLGMQTEAVETAEALSHLLNESFEKCPQGIAPRYELTWALRAYRDAGLTDEFITKIEEQLENRDSVAHLEVLLEASRKTDRADAARERLRSFVEAHPEEHRLRARFASQLFSEKKTDEAIEFTKRLLADYPQYLDELGDRLRWVAREKNLQDGVENTIIDAASRIDNTQVILQLARNFVNSDRYETAVALYRRALEIRPSFLDAQFQLARSLSIFNRHSEAEDILLSYLTQLRQPIQSFDEEALAVIVAVFDETERVEELKSTLAQFAIDEPEASHTMVDAVVAERNGRLAEAYTLYETLYAQHPSNQTLQTLVDLARRNEDWPAVVRWLELERTLSGVVNRDKLAEAFFHTGQVDKAVAEWKRMAQTSAGVHMIPHVLNRLIESELLDAAEDYYREMRPLFDQEAQVRSEVVRTILNVFRNNGRFGDIVETELSQVDQKALENILHPIAFNVERDIEGKRAFFESLLAMSPGNPAVLKTYGVFIERNDRNNREKLLELRRLLYETNPEDEELRKLYVEAIGKMRATKETYDLLWEWILARPAEESTALLAREIGETHQYRTVIRMRDELLGDTPPDELVPIAAGLAPAVAAAGDLPWAEAVLERRMEQSPSKENYEAYLRLLLEFEDYPKAYALYARHGAEYHKAYLYSDRMALAVALSGDVVSIENELWRVSRILTEPQFWLGRIARALAASPGAVEGFNRFEARVQTDPEAKREHWVVLANLHYEQRNSARAIEIFSQLCDDYPNNSWYCRRMEEIQRSPEPPGEPKPYGLPEQRTAAPLDIVADSIELLVREDDWPAAMAFLQEMKNRGGAGFGVDDTYYKLRLGIALIWAGEYADALPLLEDVNTQSGTNAYAAALACAYAGVGRAAEALEMYPRATQVNSSDAYFLANALLNAHQWNDAIQFLSSYSDSEIHQHLALVAKASLEAGAGNDYRPLFREVQGTTNGRYLHGSYQQFLKLNNLFEEAAATANLRDDSLLVEVLAEVFARPDTANEPWRDAVKAALLQAADASPESAYVFAGALDDEGEADLAIEWYAKAALHPDQTEERRDDACSKIIWSDVNGATSVLMPVVTQYPEVLPRVHGLFAQLMQRDSAGLDAVISALPEDAVASAEFPRSLMAFAVRGDIAVRQSLLARAETGELDESQRCLLADALEFAGELDTLHDWTLRLIACNGSVREQRAVLGDCMTTALVQRRYDITAWCAAKLYLLDVPEWQAARDTLIEKASVDDVPPLREQLAALIQEAPNHPRAPHLLMLSADLAAKAGEDLEAAALAESLGLPETTIQRTRVWQNMARSWLVAGPEKLPEGDLNMSWLIPSNLKGSLTADVILPPLPGGWRAAALDPAYGQLEMDRALGLEQSDTARTFGYAVTEFISPDERTVTFALGSDAWSYMWLNGEIVHWNYDHRPAIVDQDILELKLSPGRNRFVSKLGNDHDQWEFSLSPIKGDDGLENVLPSPELGNTPGPTPEAEAGSTPKSE